MVMSTPSMILRSANRKEQPIFFIEDRYATLVQISIDNVEKKGLRLYRWWRSSATIQLCTKSEKVGYMISTTLTKEQCRELAAELNMIADELEG